VLEHLRAGGKWKTLAGLRTPKPVRGRTYLLDEVAVDGSAADEPHELETVIAASGRLIALCRFEQLWSGRDAFGEVSDPRMRIASCRELAKSLSAALAFGQRERDLRSSLESLTSTVVSSDSLQSDSDGWQRLLMAARLEQRRLAITSKLDTFERSLASQAVLHDANPILQSIRSAVVERNLTEYGHLMDRLARYGRVRSTETGRLRVRAVLSGCAPDLLTRVEAELHDSGWRARLLDLEAAWSWAVADRWLERRGDPQRATRLEAKRRAAAKSVTQFTSELAAELAWKHFFERLSPAENNALKSWREAVRQMGKGTGRSAKM